MPVSEGVPEGVCVPLGVAVPLPLCVCVGVGQGSQIVALAPAEPNWVRHTTGSTTKRAVVLGSGQVALAAPPDAGVGHSVVVHAEPLSHTYTGGNCARPARPHVAEEKFVAVQATRAPRGALHCAPGTIFRKAEAPAGGGGGGGRCARSQSPSRLNYPTGAHRP